MKLTDFRAVAVLVAVLLQGCGSGASSSPASHWSVPAMVTNDLDLTLFAPRLSADSLGNMSLVASWNNFAPLNSATQSAVALYQKQVGMNWSARLALSPIKTVTPPQLAFDFRHPQLQWDSAGNAVAAWVEVNSNPPSTSNVYVRNFSATTGWGAPMLMQFSATSDATSVNLTVQADGTAWVVWLERTYMDPTIPGNDTYAFFAAKYVPATGWSPAERLTADYARDLRRYLLDSRSVLLARVVTDNAGNPTVLFTPATLDLVGNLALSPLYSTAKAAGVWSAPTLIHPLVSPLVFDIAEDTRGNAIAVWVALDPTGTSGIYSKRYTPASGWGGSVVMSSLLGFRPTPELAMDRLGNAVLLWSEPDPRGLSASGIWAARFDSTLGWQTPAIISSPPEIPLGSSFNPQVAFDAQGNAVAVWQKTTAFNQINLMLDAPNFYAIMGCRYTNNAGWSKDEIISDPNDHFVKAPRLAVSANGRATAVWSTQDFLPSRGGVTPLWSSDFAP